MLRFSWQFKTDDNDIGFGVEYRPTEDSDDIEDIVPLGRHESHLQIQDGNIVCDKTGVCEYPKILKWPVKMKLSC